MFFLALFGTICVAYLFGSIPFGYILTKNAGLGDIRDIGSGSIGATNVLRTGNKKLAALTLVMDGLKGGVAVWLAALLGPDFARLAAVAVLLGHIFPVWLNFKGGKGVATMIGVVLALCWPVGLLTVILWLFMALCMRYSSLAALVAMGLIPIEMMFFGRGDLFLLSLLMVLLVFWKHKANIERLIRGEEPKISGKKETTTL